MKYFWFRLRTAVPYLLGKIAVRVIFVFIQKWKIVVVGAENQPRHGAVLYAANHLHFMDSLILGLTIKRQAGFLAKSEYFKSKGFKNKAFAFALWATGMISVDRSGGRANDSLGIAQRLLGWGYAIVVHVEGTRSRDGYLNNARTGFVSISKATKAVVVPSAVVYPNGPESKYGEVRYGAPITYSEYKDLKPVEFAELVTARIHELDPSRPRSGRLAKIVSLGKDAIEAIKVPLAKARRKRGE